MSTTPSHPSLPLTSKPNQFRSETLGPDRSAPHDAPDPTTFDSSTRKGQEDDPDSVKECEREEYDNVYQDLGSQVFVDFEVFLQSVLRVPCDWKTLWGPAIEGVKMDQEFSTHRREYRWQCKEYGSVGQSFSDALMKIANSVTDVMSTSKFDGISGNPLQRANDLRILEGKLLDGVICKGKRIPRLIVDGIDPILNHAPPHNPARSKSRESTSPTLSTIGSEPTSSRKRGCDGSLASSQRASKKPRTFRLDEEDETSLRAEGESESSSASTTETRTQSGPAPIQVYSYFLGMFSDHLLRSHATICLVDRNRLQLYHANRSVILVSSAINISKGDGLDQFIAVIIAFHCLSLEEKDMFAMDNIRLVKNPNLSSDNKAVQNQDQLELTEDGSGKKFAVTLGDIISHNPAIVGRSTLVLRARSDQWPNTNLVVKVSWPDVGWGAESEFLEKAIEEAKKTEGGWATKHLPRMFWATDVIFGEDPTLESVANLFQGAGFVGKNYAYKRRILRIIVQEELYPLKSLTNVKDIGQVFVDIACIHRWLYNHPGILHCDLSPNNIMCCIVEGLNAKRERERRVYGVLTDYDLSSWTKDLKDCTKTSQQCTGTPPYMAHELLEGESVTHLYRHDLESLFTIMTLTCTRYTFDCVQRKATRVPLRAVTRGGKRPYQDWFDEQNYIQLGDLKSAFFRRAGHIELSTCFEDFYLWLLLVRRQFLLGFQAQARHATDLEMQQCFGSSAEEIAPFDDETLGGNICYSSFIEPVRRLKGELEGLVIRYDPKEISTPSQRD